MLGNYFRCASRSFSSRSKLPESARVVIVGGGIIGTSVAYHLAHAGWRDVVLLERDQLTSGTTWHAAGLMVTFGSLSATATEMRQYSKQLYTSLEAETGQATGFKPVGFIELATDKHRQEEYRRIAAFNRKCGVDVQEISAAEVQSLFPLIETTGIESGFYVPSDGRVNPVDATAALAKGAQQQGAMLYQGVSVDAVLDDGRGKVTGVKTTDGHVIQSEFVVNCAGMWARQLAEKSKVILPNQAAQHSYLITDTIEGVDPNWPVVEDPSSYAYIRPEGDGLMVGLFEGEGAAWQVDKVPHDFSFGELQPDWDRLSPYLEKAMARVPKTLEVGAKKLFCGPESFTPDGSPCAGEVPELKNYFVAAGMNSIGILSGGGIGRLIAHWIVNGQPDMDVTGIRPSRFQSFHNMPAFRASRVKESLESVYQAHYPHKPTKTCRNVKRSPLHARLEEQGAAWRDVSGWECADWFAGSIKEDDEDNTRRLHAPLSWGRHHWFETWQNEHLACRQSAGVIDMSFMSKFKVQGRDAGALLDHLSTAAVDSNVEPGTITYTQWLNHGGTLEADLTVMKLPRNHSSDENEFLVVATDSAHRHVESRMQRFIRGLGEDPATQGKRFAATVCDMSSGLAQLNLQGPDSRRILAAATAAGSNNGSLFTCADVSDEAFPFRACRELSIGFAPVLASRITYVGELGYELFVDAAQAVYVYDALFAAAATLSSDEHGYEEVNGSSSSVVLRPVGLKALGSLRLEKGYRDYGHDLDNTDSLGEAGLAFTVTNWEKKPYGFVGQAAAAAEKSRGVSNLKQRLLQVQLLNPSPLLFHGEVVYRNGSIVGDIRSASYGHSLGAAVGLAMVSKLEHQAPLTAKAVATDEWEVDVAGVRHPAKASIKPFFDPTNTRIKA